MRSIALRHADHATHVSNRTFALVSVAACLALAGAILALVLMRQHAEARDLYVPIAHESYSDRQLRMGWSELGAVAAVDPPEEKPAPAPNQSLPPEAVSKLASTTTSAVVAPNVLVTQPVNVSSPAASTTSIAPSALAPNAPAPTAFAAGTPNNSAPNPPAAAPPAAQNAPAPTNTDVPCGTSTCTGGQVCCNASCGTCAEPGQKCSQAVCGMSASLDSVPCGPNTCNSGQLCCNPSCGTCVAPGETCDPHECADAIQYPVSQSCGMSTCNVGTVCCNPSCGICAAPGESCSQRACT